ncbi:MAG: helicase [Chaenotheca gracillima]|nr:MAG: helicase [Chaenotheca gracillima]
MPATTRDSKRPFQPSITSFFGRTDRNDYESAEAFRGERPSSPVLPSHIQSSLLNVGMRVRKSVPEGYRTKKGMVHDTFQPSSTYSQESERRPPTRSNGGGSGRVELTPFCGIMKIGGFAEQDSSSSSSSSFPSFYPDDFSAFELPDSSQESNISVAASDSAPVPDQGTFRRKNKRRFEGGADRDDCVIFDQDDLLTSSSSSYPVSHTSMPKFDSLRPMARPKTRRRYHICIPRDDDLSADQEGVEVHAMSDQDDFDEAEFLRPPTHMDHEVEMGGI